MGNMDLGGAGLARGDSVLARVVVDLGLATPEDVQAAAGALTKLHAKGDRAKDLLDVLTDTGKISTRYASTVRKAMRRSEAAGAASATRPAERASEPESPPSPRAPVKRQPARGGGPAVPGRTAEAVYGKAPKGEGFGVRSKKDIASAWAAHREGKGPEPSKPAPPPAQPEKPAAEPPEVRPGPVMYGGGTRQERSKPKPKPKPTAPGWRRRLRSTGVTSEIDVESLRRELGIEKSKSGPKKEAAPAPADPEKTKEVALRAFVRRIVRSRLHQQCLDTVLRRRLTTMTPGQLASSVGCREREAKRVLEDWRSGGIVRRTELEPYTLSLPKADMAAVREFMVLWDDHEWHQKLLRWILEEEGR